MSERILANPAFECPYVVRRIARLRMPWDSKLSCKVMFVLLLERLTWSNSRWAFRLSALPLVTSNQPKTPTVETMRLAWVVVLFDYSVMPIPRAKTPPYVLTPCVKIVLTTYSWIREPKGHDKLKG